MTVEIGKTTIVIIKKKEKKDIDAIEVKKEKMDIVAIKEKGRRWMLIPSKKKNTYIIYDKDKLKNVVRQKGQQLNLDCIYENSPLCFEIMSSGLKMMKS